MWEHHLRIFVVTGLNLGDSVDCRNVPLTMTKFCSAAFFKSTPHYSSVNFRYVEDQQLLHNIVKNQLDIFGYSSVSELQSVPTLVTLLPGFCPRVYRDRKVITVCESTFCLNCKQHVMFHQGTKTSVNTAQFCLCENPINRWLSMKKSARRCLFCS